MPGAMRWYPPAKAEARRACSCESMKDEPRAEVGIGCERIDLTELDSVRQELAVLRVVTEYRSNTCPAVRPSTCGARRWLVRLSVANLVAVCGLDDGRCAIAEVSEPDTWYGSMPAHVRRQCGCCARHCS